MNKYANAQSISIDVDIQDDHLKMQIIDDGVGFDTAIAKPGIGLSNMKRRAELFSGKLSIDSSPGNGCTITVQIPIENIDALEIKESAKS
ncbi:MAG: hypothetical protein EOO04_34530 [Chitinophagaceae bacterium]|nr:MAG: hypothetical protein EOO04_34530 [Chitinophagaceae bacterium]